MAEEVRHIHENTRYRVVIERAASTKGVLGYKVEANGDSAPQTIEDAKYLKMMAEAMTLTVPQAEIEKEAKP